jgi:hypothetical protein
MSEALRIAECIDFPSVHLGHEAAAELRRLHADLEESDALRERLSGLLRETAIAICGPEPDLTNWSWHDLPERVAQMMALNAELVRALEKIWNEASTNCGYIGMSIADTADAALAKVEEQL